jgi:hypothetical protein
VTDTAEPNERRERLSALFDREGWRTEIEIRRRELANRLIAAKASQPPGSSRYATAVDNALCDACTAIGSRGSLKAWWTGSAITMAWESVHDAEGDLVEIESDEAVRASLPRLRSWINEVVVEQDLRERYDKVLGDFIDGTQPLDRTVVRQAYQDVTIANNERHASLRTFRNLLVCATAVLATLLIGVALWHALNPRFVSLCGTTPGTGARDCLMKSTPSGGDVIAVELIGAIGGLLSIAFGLGSATTAPSRYNVRAAQAGLKPFAGAATALVGVLLLQAHILVTPSDHSESLLLAYAAIFGFSQQLLTQFVDRRAGQLLEPEAETKK